METALTGTSRNFLFATNQDDVALTRLLAMLRKRTGFLDGAPGGALPGWYVVGADNSAVLETLYTRLAANYPDAGQPFYATRIWTNLLWQPAYVAVLAVHIHGALPQFSRLAQSVKNIDISGFRLAPGPQMEGDTETLIREAGAQLRAMADVAFEELKQFTRIKRLPALRLLADRIIDLIRRLSHFAPETTVAQQQRYCALWLAAMGLTGQGSLEEVQLDDGSAALILARKGCCLDYLAFPDAYCRSCPKQDDAVWRARQIENANAERGSAD